MVFKRRDRRPIWKIALETLWPKGGWGRAAIYVKHRLFRLSDPPDRIARGIFAGVFTTFTPFYGLHFVISALLAWIMRGNILASLLATFFGNPLTYVPIGVISMKTGYWLLGLETTREHGGVLRKFGQAGDDLWHNFKALFTTATPDWTNLRIFYDEVFFPYMIGGLIPGIVFGLIAYYVSLPLVTAYQNRRRGTLQARLAQLKKRGTSNTPSE